MTPRIRAPLLIEGDPVALVPLSAADRRTIRVALLHWDAWWRQHPDLLWDASARAEFARLQRLLDHVFDPV